MARYKDYSFDQILMVPVSFEKQILSGSFEFTLCHLIDNQIDMSIFDEHYDNDETGAPQVFVKQKTLRTPNIRHYAYDPAILLKVILFDYSRPHFTTIADFISSRHEEISSLFTMILSDCYSRCG